MSIVYSPDGKTILTRCFRSNTARLWDASSRQPIGKALEHQSDIDSEAFSPDGKIIVTGSSDRTARLWDAATGLPIGQPLVHRSEVTSVAYSPDARTILTASGERVFLWDSVTKQPLGRPLEHPSSIKSLAYDPNGKTFLSVAQGTDKAVRLWSATTGQQIGDPMVGREFIAAATFGQDGKTVLTINMRNEALLWDASSGRPIGQTMNLGDRSQATTKTPRERIQESFRNQVRSVVYSPDWRMIATSGLRGETRLWDAASGRPILSRVDANHVAFSPDGKTILTGGKDKIARRWDATTGHPIGQSMMHDESVTFVAFSPDGKTIITGSGGIATLWDAASSQPIGRSITSQQGVRPVELSPDGKRILARTGTTSLGVWDVASGQLIGQPMVHERSVTSTALSSDFGILLTGSVDGNVRMWDTGTGQPIGPVLLDQGQVTSVAYSPDGKSFATANNDLRASRREGTARLWRVADLVEDDLQRIQAWVETISALAVNDQGNINTLESDAWRVHRERLRKLGGSPKFDSGSLFDPVLYGPDPTVRHQGLDRTWMLGRGRGRIHGGRSSPATENLGMDRVRPASSWRGRKLRKQLPISCKPWPLGRGIGSSSVTSSQAVRSSIRP